MDGNINGNKVGLKHRHKKINISALKNCLSLSRTKFSKLVSENLFGEFVSKGWDYICVCSIQVVIYDGCWPWLGSGWMATSMATRWELNIDTRT